MFTYTSLSTCIHYVHSEYHFSVWEWHKVEVEQVKWSLGRWTQPTGCFSRDSSWFSLPFLSPSPPLCPFEPGPVDSSLHSGSLGSAIADVHSSPANPEGTVVFMGGAKGAAVLQHCTRLRGLWVVSDAEMIHQHCCWGYREMLFKPLKTIAWMRVLRSVQSEFWNTACERGRFLLLLSIFHGS